MIDRTQIDRETYNDVRNYLLTRVALANRQRAAAVANMTVQDFMYAKRSKRTKMYTVLVSSHKTAATYGTATLGISEDLHFEIVNFQGNIRYSIFFPQTLFVAKDRCRTKLIEMFRFNPQAPCRRVST